MIGQTMKGEETDHAKFHLWKRECVHSYLARSLFLVSSHPERLPWGCGVSGDGPSKENDVHACSPCAEGQC